MKTLILALILLPTFSALAEEELYVTDFKEVSDLSLSEAQCAQTQSRWLKVGRGSCLVKVQDKVYFTTSPEGPSIKIQIGGPSAQKCDIEAKAKFVGAHTYRADEKDCKLEIKMLNDVVNVRSNKKCTEFCEKSAFDTRNLTRVQ